MGHYFCQYFWIPLQLDRKRLAIWLNSTTIYMYFWCNGLDSTLWGNSSGQADTYCMDNVFATSQQGGVWKYMDIPGMLRLCLDWNACCILLWNLQTDSWLISPNLAYGRGTNRVFGVCWKAAWCQYIWNDYNDVWGCFRGEQDFGKFYFWTLMMRMWFLEIIPHIFVWGSCFWSCIPGLLRLVLPPPAFRLHTHTLTHNYFSHTITSHTHKLNTQLCHIPSLTYNNFTHTNLTYNNFTHTLTHTLSHNIQ